VHVTGFTAGTAVVLAVFAQADFEEALAEAAVFIAAATALRLVADAADEFLGHSGRLARIGFGGNGTMVMGLKELPGMPELPKIAGIEKLARVPHPLRPLLPFPLTNPIMAAKGGILSSSSSPAIYGFQSRRFLAFLAIH
jgi:hypothetical protein